jgi:hypothetical protein
MFYHIFHQSYTDMAIAHGFTEAFEVLHTFKDYVRLRKYPVQVDFIRPVGVDEHTLHVGFGTRYIIRIQLPPSPVASFSEMFPLLTKDMLSLGRPFSLLYPPGRGHSGSYPDRLHGFFIKAETAGGNRGDDKWAVLCVNARNLQH